MKVEVKDDYILQILKKEQKDFTELAEGVAHLILEEYNRGGIKGYFGILKKVKYELQDKIEKMIEKKEISMVDGFYKSLK